MPEAWVEQETDAVDFGDARLDRRLMKLLTALGSQPQASVPAATGNRNDMAAAYEFFANPRVTPGQILAGHIEATHGRNGPDRTRRWRGPGLWTGRRGGAGCFIR
jgi:hypothetical protein